MSEAPAAFEVAFLDKLQRLLAEGDFTATYKFAVLLGLVELSVEAAPDTDTFTTRQLAEKVVELYWPHVRRFEDKLLRQNSSGQARIIAAIDDFQTKAANAGLASFPVEVVAHRLSPQWKRLLDEVEWKLIEMPLPRLQGMESGGDEFLYGIDWTLHDAKERTTHLSRAVRGYQRSESSEFDNRILMRPGIVATLARFHGIIRDLVENRWVRKVRELNDVEGGEHGLHAHLFGIKRSQLVKLAGPLGDLQSGRCFYCHGRLGKSDVDHFLPWARYPDNRLENLVAVDARCNQSKSAYLAAVEHLERWLRRFGDAAMVECARTMSWPTGGRATLAISRRLYAHEPEHARLWFAPGEYRAWRHEEAEARISETEERLTAA